MPDPISIREAASKNYVDNLFNDPSIIKNTEHIDLNDRNITNCRFLSVNQLPQIDSHLTAKLYVDNSTNESSVLRLDPIEKLDLDNQDSIILNSTLTDPKTVIEIPTKAFIDSLHEENERSRRDLGIDFYDESGDSVKNNQNNDFNDNIILNVASIQINNNPTNDDHAVNKKFIDDEIDTNTIVRLNDNSHDHYLQVRVNTLPYNLQIYNKTQIIDNTKMIFPNTGYDLLQNWKIVCNNRHGEGKPSDFIKSTKTNSPTGDSGASSLPPIGSCFMFIESSSNNHNSANDNVFVSFERTDIIHISNITFYYNRFSSSAADKRNMGKFEILLLRNGVWEIENTMKKNTNFSTLSTDWTLFNMNIISQPNYGIKLVYSGKNSDHADMCFSDINLTHSIF